MIQWILTKTSNITYNVTIPYQFPNNVIFCSLCIVCLSNQAKQWFLLFYFRIVPPPNRAYLRTLIHNGDLEHLEKVVLDGHGAKLMHETSALDKVSKFIYALPDFMVSTKLNAVFEYLNSYNKNKIV